MYSQLPRPTIFAHRGSSAHAPENTLAAFDLAVSQAADAIELDAKLCGDGHVVVIHDQSVERTTDGDGKVFNLPLAALKELDAGSWFGVEFKRERIPTLEEVFETVGRKIFINVEITNYASPRDQLPEKIADLVRQHGLEKQVLFSSFNPLALRSARRLLPEVPIGLLALPGFPGVWARSRVGGWILPYEALHPELQDTDANLIQRHHEKDQRVHAWTVNAPEDLKRLFQIGVDGIFTDDPSLARKIRAEVIP